jgi:hypothetical protein
LALVVDHALRNGGRFPDNDEVRRYGRDLTSLLKETDRVAERRGVEEKRRLPHSEIHTGIVETLSRFATNLTRYYNLDLVTSAKGVDDRLDPVVEWQRTVTDPVLARHYPDRSLRRDLARSAALDQLAGPYMLVRFFAEDGTAIRSLGAAAQRTAETEFARRWERMYVLQLARFAGAVVAELGYQGGGLEDIPAFSEFFALFHNSDAYFRGRKTWSIHRP